MHIVGVSSLAAGHLTLVPELKAALDAQGRGDIMIVVGGVVPPQDYDALQAAGAEAIFPPGTVIAEAAEELLRKLNRAARPRPRGGGVGSYSDFAERSRKPGSTVSSARPAVRARRSKSKRHRLDRYAPRPCARSRR